ncbi:MAG: amino acid ABC transporter permease [Clostridia bacterium]|nr:amino acid ABC transporter permease [Clostridia bacterium]
MVNFTSVTVELFSGFGMTCLLFILTLAFALPLGLIICFGSMTKFKPLRYLVRAFVWVIRGTPLMLQLFVVFYVPGMVFNTPIFAQFGNYGRFVAALIAFVINYACYFSEIYRGGIESVSKGQYEAGQVLGMTKSQIFFKIVLKQVIKNIVPPMSNEIITLVKDTSLARVIAVADIIFKAEEILSLKALIWPLFYAGAFYLIFNGLLTVLFRWSEKRLSYFHS